MLKFDEQTQTFTWTINNREITAGAFATAFMCLFQTLSTLENVAQRGIGDKLNRLYTIHTRSTEVSQELTVGSSLPVKYGSRSGDDSPLSA